jgi:type VI secretion system protein ImpK
MNTSWTVEDLQPQDPPRSSTGLPSLEKSELFPEAYPKDSLEAGPQRRRFRSSALIVAGLIAPVLLFGFLYLIYRFTLSGTGGSLLQAIR